MNCCRTPKCLTLASAWKRPRGEIGLAQSARGLSAALAAHPLLRREAAKVFGLSDQPHGHACPDGGIALQEALGHRVVFQMDQGKPSPQALFRNESECCENANLDRNGDLLAGGDLAQGTQFARKPQQNTPDFERSSV